MTRKKPNRLIQRWVKWRKDHSEMIILIGFIGALLGIFLVPPTIWSFVHPATVGPIVVTQTVHDIERVPSATITVTTRASATVTRATTTTTTLTTTDVTP